MSSITSLSSTSASSSSATTQSGRSSNSHHRNIQRTRSGPSESTIMKIMGVVITCLGIGVCFAPGGAVAGVPLIFFGAVAAGAPTCVDCMETTNRLADSMPKSDSDEDE